jgi:RHS repeat-associated protein
MRFAGELADADGFYYLGARQYAPEIGRFLQVDPARSTSTSAAASTYVYANDRPTVMVDPSGATSVPSRAFRGATVLASSVTGTGPPKKKRPRIDWKELTKEIVTWMVDQLNNPEYGGEMEVNSGEAVGLTHWLAGVPASMAEAWVRAFDAPIYLVSLQRGWHFRRYYSDNPAGRWLTRERFRTPAAAIAGLNLPAQNEATCRQIVTVNYDKTEGLRGGIRGGRPPGILQWMVFRYRERLRFGPCVPSARWDG